MKFLLDFDDKYILGNQEIGIYLVIGIWSLEIICEANCWVVRDWFKELQTISLIKFGDPYKYCSTLT